MQQQDPELAYIYAKLQRGDKIDRYVLSQGALYWHALKGQPSKFVLPAAAKAMIFASFHESTLGAH
jgi:hypothetical protein